MATQKDNPGPKDGPPTLPTIGKELRTVVEHPSRSTRRRTASRLRSPDGPSLPHIGAQLRDVATRLKRVESYVIVACMALDSDVAQNDRIAGLLRHDAGDLLFKQIAHLAKLAKACDGLPLDEVDAERVEDWEEDGAAENDTEGQLREGDK